MTTVTEWTQALTDTWLQFVDIARALTGLLAGSRPMQDQLRSSEEAILRGADRLATSVERFGAEAADEVRFAANTYLSTLDICRHFQSLGPPTDVDRDNALSRSFEFNANLHVLGVLLISAIASDEVATSTAVEQAFCILRDGALGSYADIRQAYDLRVPQDASEPMEPTAD